MAKKKRTVVTTEQTNTDTGNKSSTDKSVSESNLVFGRETYKWVLIGVGLIVVGMLLMIGGFNENPNEWDESGIYGFRRTVLAPIVILSGLVVNIYALFK